MAILFDLNIEKILEDWEIYHAIREVIANALDEQQLTHSKEIEIYPTKSGSWIIRDFGRGLNVQHLTQNENKEKLANPNMIGKFGIGLKDALATFERRGVKVTIRSKYNDITLAKAEKAGFRDIITLHALVDKPSDPNMVGTVVELSGVTAADIDKAKDLFLKFSGEKILDSTEFGDVLEKKVDSSRIYINGVKVAEEDNFLFSYNITALTGPLRKALNRERMNVGRSAYQERVKKILVSSKSKVVAEKLAEDLRGFGTGLIHDELKWVDVQEHAVKILNATDKLVFLTPQELAKNAMMVDQAKNMGYKIVTVPERLKERIQGLTDLAGNPIVDLGEFVSIYDKSFKFKFVDPDKLTPQEKQVFSKTSDILALVGGKPGKVKEIRISETMRPSLGSLADAEGLWDGEGTIIIKRSVLGSIEKYTGVLIHELAHARGDAPDVSREFETDLTDLTGLAGSKALWPATNS
ncbi:MAG: ATP-binding protein [Thermoprotei archaeon]